jgi:hypothetical protein
MADAQRARLAGGDSMYAKYPKTMLRHRAAAELARQVYPDIVLGLYAEAEREDIEALDVTPMQRPAPQVVTEPVSEPTAAAAAESIDDMMARWKAALFTASTIAECDRVGRDMNKKLTEGSPEYAAALALYNDRKRELKTRHTRPRPVPTAAAPQDAELVNERNPGEEG